MAGLLGPAVVAVLGLCAAPPSAAASARPDIRTITFGELKVMLDTDRGSSTGIRGVEYALDCSQLSPDGETLQDYSWPVRFPSAPRSATFSVAVADVPRLPIRLGVPAIGAALGIAGWHQDRLPTRPPPTRPLEVR